MGTETLRSRYKVKVWKAPITNRWLCEVTAPDGDYVRVGQPLMGFERKEQVLRAADIAITRHIDGSDLPIEINGQELHDALTPERPEPDQLRGKDGS